MLEIVLGKQYSEYMTGLTGIYPYEYCLIKNFAVILIDVSAPFLENDFPLRNSTPNDTVQQENPIETVPKQFHRR